MRCKFSTWNSSLESNGSKSPFIYSNEKCRMPKYDFMFCPLTICVHWFMWMKNVEKEEKRVIKIRKDFNSKMKRQNCKQTHKMKSERKYMVTTFTTALLTNQILISFCFIGCIVKGEEVNLLRHIFFKNFIFIKTNISIMILDITLTSSYLVF